MSNLNDIINQQREEIAQLRTQLAKANERVKELEGDKDALMSRYGDNWYDGFMTAKDLGFDQYSESEILEMSEAYEDEKLKKPTRSDGEVIVNKFALEKKIEAIKLALDGERFELDGRPLDFGIRVESLELMLRDFEIGLNSMPIRKGGES